MEKLYEVTIQVAVSIFAPSESDAIAGVKAAINRGINEEYTTEADGFYGASATETGVA